MKLDIVEAARHALQAPLRCCPFMLQKTVLENVLNAVFGRDIDAGELDFLEGRTLTLEVSDLAWCWPITLDTGRLVLRHPGCPEDTRIRGASLELLAIAVGRRDPDTLFFQRRLVIQGDTELGLALKNFLDAAQPRSPAMQRLAGVLRAAGRCRMAGLVESNMKPPVAVGREYRAQRRTPTEMDPPRVIE